MSFDHCILGVDPGVSGGSALMDCAGNVLQVDPWLSVADTVHTLRILDGLHFFAVIEQVHASPVMSPSSCFAFGENFGQWIGILASLGVTTYGIRPQEWQCRLKFLAGTQGPARKRLLKEHAKKEWAAERVTLATCDALLIGDYAVRYAIDHGHLPGKVIV